MRPFSGALRASSSAPSVMMKSRSMTWDYTVRTYPARTMMVAPSVAAAAILSRSIGAVTRPRVLDVLPRRKRARATIWRPARLVICASPRRRAAAARAKPTPAQGDIQSRLLAFNSPDSLRLQNFARSVIQSSVYLPQPFHFEDCDGHSLKPARHIAALVCTSLK